jgi:hypothetical protein
MLAAVAPVIASMPTKEKDGNIEYGNIVERKWEHRNGNIKKLLKSGELRKKQYNYMTGKEVFYNR